MAKTYDIVDITRHSPEPLHAGLTLSQWDQWYGRNNAFLLHWAVMKDDRLNKQIVIVALPGHKFC